MPDARRTLERFKPGMVFGVVEIIGPVVYEWQGYRTRARCEVRCQLCGAVSTVHCHHLAKGPARCVHCPPKHGEARTRLYSRWQGIVKRCHSPGNHRYPDYGGRGISVCREWRDSFVAFRDWAFSSGYRPGLLIDRVNNDGNYEPSNCRWVTPTESSRNRRANRPVTAFGETKCQADWVSDPRCMVSKATLKKRLEAGERPESAMTKPGRGLRRKDRSLAANVLKQFVR